MSIQKGANRIVFNKETTLRALTDFLNSEIFAYSEKAQVLSFNKTRNGGLGINYIEQEKKEDHD